MWELIVLFSLPSSILGESIEILFDGGPANLSVTCDTQDGNWTCLEQRVQSYGSISYNCSETVYTSDKDMMSNHCNYDDEFTLWRCKKDFEDYISEVRVNICCLNFRK